jgi:hypothetical protein
VDSLFGVPDIKTQLFRLVMSRARQLVVRHGVVETASSSPLSSSPQDERRAHALATIEACTELGAELDRRADDAALSAQQSRASYAEIGAARGVTRQAARQAVLRRRRDDALEQQRRRAELDDDDWDRRYQQDLASQEREDRWPPRVWQYRAPTGYRTVALIDGPAAGHTDRIPVGDDAFPFIDHYQVFGRRHARHARYTAAAPTSDQYRFTGEYFVRWS